MTAALGASVGRVQNWVQKHSENTLPGCNRLGDSYEAAPLYKSDIVAMADALERVIATVERLETLPGMSVAMQEFRKAVEGS